MEEGRRTLLYSGRFKATETPNGITIAFPNGTPEGNIAGVAFLTSSIFSAEEQKQLLRLVGRLESSTEPVGRFSVTRGRSSSPSGWLSLTFQPAQAETPASKADEKLPRIVKTFDKQVGRTEAVSLSRNRSRFATLSSGPGVCTVWDSETGEKIKEKSADISVELRLSHRRPYILLSDLETELVSEHQIILRNFYTEKAVRIGRSLEQPRDFDRYAESPNGKLVAIAFEEYVANSPKQRDIVRPPSPRGRRGDSRPLVQTLEGTDQGTPRSATLPDVIQKIALIDVEQKRLVKEITRIARSPLPASGIVTSLAFDSSGTVLAVADETGHISFMDINTGNSSVNMKNYNGNLHGYAQYLAFSCDGKYLVSCHQNDGLFILRTERQQVDEPQELLEDHTYGAKYFRFLKGDKSFFCVCSSRVITRGFDSSSMKTVYSEQFSHMLFEQNNNVDPEGEPLADISMDGSYAIVATNIPGRSLMNAEGKDRTIFRIWRLP